MNILETTCPRCGVATNDKVHPEARFNDTTYFHCNSCGGTIEVRPHCAGPINRAPSKLPPGPFEYMTTARLDDHHGMGHVYIVDANGRKIASIWGKPDEKMAMVEMVIDARGKLP